MMYSVDVQPVAIVAVLTALVFMAPWAMSTAAASPLWESGGGDVSGQAFSPRMTADSGDAAYFNPARLANQSQRTDVAFSGLFGQLDITYGERPDGVDISERIYDARIEESDGTRRAPATRPLPTDDLPRQRGDADPSFGHQYATVAATIPIIDDRWAVGMLTTVSAESFSLQQPYHVDEREQYFSNSLHFERYGDRLVGAEFALGTGVAITDAIRLGVGGTLAQDARSENEMFSADATQPENSEVNTAVEVSTRFVPHVGVDAEPVDGWTLSATAHAPYANRVDGSNEIRFWNFPIGDDGEDVVEQDLSYLYDFEPWRIGAGSLVEWSGERRDYEVGLHVQYDQWSNYVNRQGEIPQSTWRNTITPTISGAVDTGTDELRGDLQFSPSPVPTQRGRSNYVDNSIWAASAGWARQFTVLDWPVEVDVQTQFQWLVEREHQKSSDADDPVIDEFPESIDAQSGETIEESRDFRTNNPGYPGYRSSGFVVGLGLVMGTEF